MSKLTREQHLKLIEEAQAELDGLEVEFQATRLRAKKRFVKRIEEAKEDIDLGITEVADHLGKTRQAIHRHVKDVHGIRFPDKSKAGSLGHVKEEVSV